MSGERWLSRLERKTLDRGVMGSNPPTVLRNLGKLSSTFEKDASMSQTKRRFFMKMRKQFEKLPILDCSASRASGINQERIAGVKPI